ncbi:MAG: AraC family transcriptional regulator [Clostridia bacterium]|nr:AraC family transcriptional regulator [Clostridia bacterium]
MAEITFPDGSVFRCNSKRSVGESMHSHHYHDRFEIYYLTGGRCHFFIDNRSYDLVAGDLILIPEGIIHRTNYGVDEEQSRVVLEFSSRFVPESVRAKLPSMVYLFRNPTLTAEIHEMIRAIDGEFKNPDEFTCESLEARISALLFFLARNRALGGSAASKNSMIEDVINYIKGNFAQDIKLANVAKSHFVSPEHLSRTFKHDTGFGFNEFLSLIRLQHAEHLLKERGARSISEIAYSCGFNDSNYFSDKFRRTYGVSPLKYSKSTDSELK